MVENKIENSKKIADKNEEDIKLMSNALINNDIDQMIELLKNVKNVKTHGVYDLNQLFIDNHINGVEMFIKMAIELEPKNAMHHYNYALFLQSQKMYDMAKNEFKIAIKLDNTNEGYRTDYGDLLFLLNDLSGSDKQYLKAIDIQPDNVHVWTNLGIIYTNKKEPKKAEKAFKKAIKMDPKYPLSYLNLIRLYKRYGKKTEAKSIWTTYQALDVKDMDLNILIPDSQNE